MVNFIKFYLKAFLILPFLTSPDAFGQNLPEQDCSGALSVCQPVYQQPNSYVGEGPTDELNTTNQGCLSSGENNTVWYIINITSPGTLEFTITPNNPSNDYDFAVWNATGAGCGAVATTPPVRCNYASNGNSSPGGLTGLSSTAANPSYGAGGPSFSSAINAQVGETYILVVDNFSSTQYGYTLDFSASTASIYDTVKPRFTSVFTHCGTVSDNVNVTLSEPVKCNSIAAGGSDFYITPAVPGVSNVIAASSTSCVGTAQFTTSLNIQFAGTLPPGNYWLHARAGTDGNSLMDNCGNEQSYADSVAFTMIAGNPPQIVRLDTPACNRARVILDREIKCNSIAANGSDFFITGPAELSVVSAKAVGCNALDMADTIDLVFSQSALLPGNYTLGVKTGTDGNSLVDTCGLSVENTITWTVSDKGLIASAMPHLICEPGYVQLGATTSLEPSPRGYQYIWHPSTYLSDSTIAAPLAFVNQNTVFEVQITDKDMCFRRDTALVTLSVRNPFLEPLKDTSLCIGDQIQFNASGGISYTWFPAAGLNCTDCPNPMAKPLETTDYYVIISDQYQCSDTLRQTLIVHPLPVVDAGEDQTIYYGEKAQLSAGTQDGAIFLWEPAKFLDYFTISNPVANPQETTVFYVSVIDKNQCKNSDSVTVFVRTDIPVFVPSAFTPNGDGKNDVFKLSNYFFHKLQEFRVFNRWGQEVFNTTDPSQGWDGNFQNTAQESGVYHYLIRVAYPDGRVETFKGDVTLLR